MTRLLMIALFDIEIFILVIFVYQMMLFQALELAREIIPRGPIGVKLAKVRYSRLH